MKQTCRIILLLLYVVTGITTVPDTTTTEVDTVAGKQKMNISACQNVEIEIFFYTLLQPLTNV